MESLFWLLALSIPILPNLWCIWHASRHDFPQPNERALWIRAGTFAPIIGGILYLAVGMRRARPASVATPVATPMATPVATPVATPLAAPATTPMAEPDNAPKR